MSKSRRTTNPRQAVRRGKTGKSVRTKQISFTNKPRGKHITRGSEIRATLSRKRKTKVAKRVRYGKHTTYKGHRIKGPDSTHTYYDTSLDRDNIKAIMRKPRKSRKRKYRMVVTIKPPNGKKITRSTRSVSKDDPDLLLEYFDSMFTRGGTFGQMRADKVKAQLVLWEKNSKRKPTQKRKRKPTQKRKRKPTQKRNRNRQR